MLSRAFTKSTRRSPREGTKGGGGSKSQSIDEQYELDAIAGWFMNDIPLIFCDPPLGVDDDDRNYEPTLRDVLRSSVGVIGESRLGMTEKIVFLHGKIHALKRFNKLIVKKMEFGRRIERITQISRRCQYLVPVTAYLYAKRIKFVLCDYYPMGSLADLLAGERRENVKHTSLDWSQRFHIVLHISLAVAFIHNQSPGRDKHMKMNVHGNIKAANVMIDVDFSARLLNYGFVQLAEPLDNVIEVEMSQKSDIYDLGVLILNLLGGDEHCRKERHEEELRDENCEFFEFTMAKEEMKQAQKLLDVALACVNKSPEARPSIQQITEEVLFFIPEMF